MKELTPFSVKSHTHDRADPVVKTTCLFLTTHQPPPTSPTPLPHRSSSPGLFLPKDAHPAPNPLCVRRSPSRGLEQGVRVRDPGGSRELSPLQEDDEMTSAGYGGGVERPWERHRDHDVEKAIEGCMDACIEQVLWYVKEDGDVDRDRAMELVSECDHNEMASVGLTLEQKLEAIETGMEDYGEETLELDLENLRSKLESYATFYINMAGAGRAREQVEGLYDAMDEHGLEPEQMRVDNPLEWLVHRAERQEDDFVVYEYRHVEDTGNHIDVWEYSLGDGPRVFFEVRPELA